MSKKKLIEEMVELATHHAGREKKRSRKALSKSQLETLADEAYWNLAFPALENRGEDGADIEEHYTRAFVEAFRSTKPKAKPKKTKKLPPPVLDFTLANVKAYVESGADVNALIERGEVFMESLLHLAAAKHHVDIIAYLLEHGADPNVADGTMGEFPLHRAVVFADAPAAAKILVAHGADPNRSALNGGPALHDAILMGHEKTVKVLVAHGAKTASASKYCDDLIASGGPKAPTYRRIRALLR